MRYEINKPIKISTLFVDSDGVPIEADGTVTVTITDSTNTVVSTGNATNDSGTGLYELVLEPLTVVDIYVVRWSAEVDGMDYTDANLLEVMGGSVASIYEIRNFNSALNDVDAEKIRSGMAEAQDRIEDYLNYSMVPRFREEVASGTGTSSIRLNRTNITSIRRISIDGVSATPSDFTVDADGYVHYTNGTFAYGDSNIQIAYIHGLTTPPSDLKGAFVRFAADKVSSGGGLMFADRAQSMSAEGASWAFVPSEKRLTGLPAVDSVLMGYKRRKVEIF